MQYDEIEKILKGLVANHVTVDELNKELDKIKIGMSKSKFTCEYIETMVSDCQKRLLVDFAIDPVKRSPTVVIMTYFCLMMELGIYIGTKMEPSRVFQMPGVSEKHAEKHDIEALPDCQCASCVKWRNSHEM